MFSIEYRYFLQAAKDLSIRRASVNLNVNSSAVVRQVKKLEYNLNTKLFLRNSRGLLPTTQGRILFKFLLSQEEILLDFKHRFDIEKGKIKGTYKIGMMESIGTNIITPILKIYQSKYPDIKFDIHAKKPEKIIDELISQKIDLGVTFSHFLPKSIRKLYERKIPMGIVASIDHPLMLKDKVSLEDLRGYPLVLHTGALSFFRQTNRISGFNQDFFDLCVTTNSLNFIKKSLLNDKNLATLSLSISLHDLYTDSLEFREIENDITQSTKVGILALTNRDFNDNETFFNKLLIKEFTNFGKKK